MLLTYACEIGDSELKASIIDIYASKALGKKIAQNFGTLTDEQSKFLEKYYEEIFNKIKLWLGKYGNFGAEAEDMASNGMEAAINAVFKYWDNFEEGERGRMVPLLVTTAINEIKDLFRQKSDFGEKSISWNILPSVKNYLDEKLRQMGYTDSSMATEDIINKLLIEEESAIEVMVKEENERRDKKAQELRQEYIGRNGTEEGFVVPQKYRHVGVGKVKTRYKTQKMQEIEKKERSMDSLDRTIDQSGEGGSIVGETISENNLFDILGFDFSASPEDQIVSLVEKRERAQLEQARRAQILNIVYNLPPAFRIIMAAAFDIDLDILQRGSELDEEARKIAKANNLSADKLIAALKTAGGKRLAWSSVKKIIGNTYEDNPLAREVPDTGKVVMIKNRDEFIEFLQDKFMDIARNMGI